MGVSGKGVVVLDSQLLAKVHECAIVKLLTIVRDKDLGIPKWQMMPFQMKLQKFLSMNVQWFCLDPFGEVVNPYDEELELLHSDKESPIISNPY